MGVVDCERPRPTAILDYYRYVAYHDWLLVLYTISLSLLFRFSSSSGCCFFPRWLLFFSRVVVVSAQLLFCRLVERSFYAWWRHRGSGLIV